jgi:protein phosphatase
MLDDEEMAQTLRSANGNLPLAAEQLVQTANEHGGRDNISVILVKVRGDYAAPRGWWQKLLARYK